MMILMLFFSVILFVIADMAIREFIRRSGENKKRREREEALETGLKLDLTREARTLKRAVVKNPAARILCIDDEDIILDSFRKILVLAGYSVDTVKTGQEALGLIQTRSYDFVFTDLKLKVPEMDGVDVVKAVKNMRPDIDVIVITGYASVETAVECMKFGAMDYVQKPFTEEELLSFVKKAMIKRQDRIEKQLKPNVRIAHAPETGASRPGEFSIPGGAFISRGHCWSVMEQNGAVRIGLDDFAKKLLGRIEGLELPEAGKTVSPGQPLFSVRQKHRRARFLAPVGGRVAKVNQALAAGCEALEKTPYYDNWICVIEADNLDTDTRALRIGKSAVALFQEDMDLFRAMINNIARPGLTEDRKRDALYIGELELLDDTQYEKAVAELFRR